MDPLAKGLITVGCFLLLGLAADYLGRKTPFPRVTILLLVGLAFGPSGFDLLGSTAELWFQIAGDIALGMIGFTIGGELMAARFKGSGLNVVWIAVVQAIATAVVVTIGLSLLGFPLPLALLLGGIATATAPAATVSVTKELGSSGPLTKALISVVALDDVVALLTFSFLIAIAAAFAGNGASWQVAIVGLWEIGAGIGIGCLVGIPLAYLSGRIRPGDPTILEVMGAVLLVVGLAEASGASYLLATVTTGALVANLAKHHERPFHAIEDIQAPWLVMFFLLAGATFELMSLALAGWLGAGYIVLRTIGKIAGCRLGTHLVKAEPVVQKWLGLTLLPHAGVAIGMALFSRKHFPEFSENLMSVVLAATVVFELIGPLLTRHALIKSGEASE